MAGTTTNPVALVPVPTRIERITMTIPTQPAPTTLAYTTQTVIEI